MDGNWDNPDNWQPATVPNGPLDTATFRASNVTDVKIGSIIEVSDIIFAANASAFIITVQIDRHHPPYEFTLSGSGVTNNSATTQNFVIETVGAHDSGIRVENNATTGRNTVLRVMDRR